MILSYPTHPNPAHPCLSSENAFPIQGIASGAWTERSLAYAVRATSRSHQLKLPARAVRACLALALCRPGFVMRTHQRTESAKENNKWLFNLKKERVHNDHLKRAA
jgi:hypothetical protein